MSTNIDNFFKTQNEQFSISNIEQHLHWQQLQQKVVNKKKFHKQMIVSCCALGVLGIFTFLYFNKTVSPKKNYVEKIAPVENNILTKNDTVSLLKKELPKSSNATIQNSKTEKLTKPNLPQQNHITPLATNFYIDLSKAPETFIINPNESNEIVCKAGTKITIPPHTVIGNTSNAVTVVVQEYYKFEKENATAAMLKYSFYENEKLLSSNDQNEVSIHLLTDKVNGKALKILHNSDIIPEATYKKLQWVTNEKFTTSNSLKTDFKIQLPIAYSAKTFMSQLTFVNHNAVIAGDIINNSIVFRKVPVGEIVYFTSLGKINEKYFSCSKKLITGNATTTELDFIEISEALYKKQIDELGRLGQ